MKTRTRKRVDDDDDDDDGEPLGYIYGGRVSKLPKHSIRYFWSSAGPVPHGNTSSGADATLQQRPRRRSLGGARRLYRACQAVRTQSPALSQSLLASHLPPSSPHLFRRRHTPGRRRRRGSRGGGQQLRRREAALGTLSAQADQCRDPQHRRAIRQGTTCALRQHRIARFEALELWRHLYPPADAPCPQVPEGEEGCGHVGPEVGKDIPRRRGSLEDAGNARTGGRDWQILLTTS